MLKRIARAAAPLTALIGLGAFLNGAAHAQTINLALYSTGQKTVFNAGTQSQYNNGDADNEWTIVSTPRSTIPTTSIVTTPNGAWVPNDGVSKWISNTLDSGSGPLPGAYNFQTSFVIPTNVNLSTVSISFDFLADNSLTSVSINGGAATGISGGGFTNPFTSATINANSTNAVFTSGTNRLNFIVQNDGATANPMGLRVKFTNATVQSTAAPEPASVALIAMGGLPALGIVARRRRNKS